MSGRGEYYRNKYGGGRGARGGGGGYGGGGRGRGGAGGGSGYGGGGGGWSGGGRGGGGGGRHGGFGADGGGPQGVSVDALPTLDAAALTAELQRIDGKPYGAYKDLTRARWALGGFELAFERVQSDAYAPPSAARVVVDAAHAGVPPALLSTRVRRTAVADFMLRVFFGAAAAAGAHERADAGGWRGGKGGEIVIARPSQHVLERSAVELTADGRVHARFGVGLPAAGRTALGAWAARVLTGTLPALVSAALVTRSLSSHALYAHVASSEAQSALRDALRAHGLVAFVGDGAILPRASGASDAPLPADAARPSEAPPSLAVELEIPRTDLSEHLQLGAAEVGPRSQPPSASAAASASDGPVRVRGLGVREGLTLIVGGGFHGKSTLLRALELGVYDKARGDGRELVVADSTALKVRTEDGRAVSGTDISPFIGPLPFSDGRPPAVWSTTAASGSTSQAAAVAEGLEAGARVLLLDEDSCATNFMSRDGRMRELVPSSREPITPLLSKVRALRSERGVSVVIAVGGCGDFLAVADCVILLTEYAASDATARAKEIAARGGGEAALAPQLPLACAALSPAERGEAQPPWQPARRCPSGASFAPLLRGRLQLRGERTLAWATGRGGGGGGGGADAEDGAAEEPASAAGAGAGAGFGSSAAAAAFAPAESVLELSACEQLVEGAQARAIGGALELAASTLMRPGRSLPEILDEIEGAMDARALGEAVGMRTSGALARPRRLELAAAFNRVRGTNLFSVARDGSGVGTASAEPGAAPMDISRAAGGATKRAGPPTTPPDEWAD